jgi:hypothetical protein
LQTNRLSTENFPTLTSICTSSTGSESWAWTTTSSLTSSPPPTSSSAPSSSSSHSNSDSTGADPSNALLQHNTCVVVSLGVLSKQNIFLFFKHTWQRSVYFLQLRYSRKVLEHICLLLLWTKFYPKPMDKYLFDSQGQYFWM